MPERGNTTIGTASLRPLAQKRTFRRNPRPRFLSSRQQSVSDRGATNFAVACNGCSVAVEPASEPKSSSLAQLVSFGAKVALPVQIPAILVRAGDCFWLGPRESHTTRFRIRKHKPAELWSEMAVLLVSTRSDEVAVTNLMAGGEAIGRDTNSTNW